MNVQSLIAWNVRRLRVDRGISQDELALVAEIERAYVGHLERGKRNPTALTLAKLARALDVRVGELFREPEAGEAPPAPLPGGRKKGGR